MDSTWTIWNWIFYFGIPTICVTIVLLNTYVESFQQWWYNNVSIRLFHSPQHNSDNNSGHGHSHAHGHGHSHGAGDGNGKVNKMLEDTKRTLFKDLGKIVSKFDELKKEGVIRILEIGTGYGSNFKYYPEKCNLIALDAFDGFKDKLLENLKMYPGIKLEKFVHSPGENMKDVQSSSVDVVIGTAVFCQVKNMQAVFKEIQRVLVPGGRFYYLDHIAAEPNTLTAFLQTILTKSKIITLFTGGHLDRKVDLEILKAGFSNVDQKYTEVDMIPHGWFNWIRNLARRLVVGVATK